VIYDTCFGKVVNKGSPISLDLVRGKGRPFKDTTHRIPSPGAIASIQTNEIRPVDEDSAKETQQYCQMGVINEKLSVG